MATFMMAYRSLRWASSILLILCMMSALSLAIQVKNWMQGVSAPLSSQVVAKIPKNPFAQPDAHYDQMDQPFLQLAWSPPSIHLPDLKPHLLFVGVNERPDLNAEQPTLYFSLKGHRESYAIPSYQPVYLIYDK